MQQSSKHLALGVVVSLLSTPLIGGGVAAYLDEDSLRDGLSTGAIVGALSGVVVSVGFGIILYVGSIRTAKWAAQEPGLASDAMSRAVADLWMDLYLFVLLAMVFGVLSGLVGGALGSYLADRQTQQQATSADA